MIAHAQSQRPIALFSDLSNQPQKRTYVRASSSEQNLTANARTHMQGGARGGAHGHVYMILEHEGQSTLVLGSSNRGLVCFGLCCVGYPMFAYPPIRSSRTWCRHATQSNPFRVVKVVPISGVLPIAILVVYQLVRCFTISLCLPSRLRSWGLGQCFCRAVI